MLTENWKTSKIIFLPLFITVKFEPKMQIRNPIWDKKIYLLDIILFYASQDYT